jgi:hypothetical protein
VKQWTIERRARASKLEREKRIVLACAELERPAVLVGFDLMKCEEGNPYTVLIEINGEVNNLVFLKNGRGSIKENSEFQFEGRELIIFLLEGSRDRKPMPQVTIYGDIHFSRDEKFEANFYVK